MPWQHLSKHAEVLAVHAAYVGFGQILYFGGDEHDAVHAKNRQFNATRLFDCNTNTVTELPSPAFDAFCSGHAFLVAANQVKLLVAGGTSAEFQLPKNRKLFHRDHFPGLRDSAIFSSPSLIPPTGTFSWMASAKMNKGPIASVSAVPPLDPIRRHCNAVILPTGEVFVCGGIDVSEAETTEADPRIVSQPDKKGVREPEIYNPFNDTWTWLRDPAPRVRNYHSVALLMPDGRVWVAGSDIDASPGADPKTLDARNLDIDILRTLVPWESTPSLYQSRTKFGVPRKKHHCEIDVCLRDPRRCAHSLRVRHARI